MKNKILVLFLAMALAFVLAFSSACGESGGVPKGNSASTVDSESENATFESEPESSTEEIDTRPDYTGNDIVGDYTVFMNNMPGVHSQPYTLNISNKLDVTGTAFGTTEITGFRGGAGVIWIDGRFTYYNGNGLIVSVANKNFSSFAATDNIYMALKNGVAITEFVNFNSHKTKLVKWTLADKSTLTVFVYGNKVYTGVTFTSEPSIRSISSLWTVNEDNNTYTYHAKTLTVFDSNGNEIATFANSGSDLKLSDGFEGTYAFDSNGMIKTEGKGDIYLSGVGKVTDGDSTYGYSLDGEYLTFNEKTVVIDREEMTYRYLTDGYEGSYAQNEDVLFLDGYGSAVLPNGEVGEYIMLSGMAKVTVNGEIFRYNLDLDEMTYSEYDPTALPIFAGWTYSGRAIPFSFAYDSGSEDDEEYYGDDSVVATLTFSSEEQALHIVSTHWSGYKYIDITTDYTYDIDTKTLTFTYKSKTVKMKFSSTMASLVCFERENASIIGTGDSPIDYCLYHVNSGETIYYVFAKQ